MLSHALQLRNRSEHRRSGSGLWTFLTPSVALLWHHQDRHPTAREFEMGSMIALERCAAAKLQGYAQASQDQPDTAPKLSQPLLQPSSDFAVTTLMDTFHQHSDRLPAQVLIRSVPATRRRLTARSFLPLHCEFWHREARRVRCDHVVAAPHVWDRGARPVRTASYFDVFAWVAWLSFVAMSSMQGSSPDSFAMVELRDRVSTSGEIVR